MISSRFCKNGHDISIVGRNKDRGCKECRRIYGQERNKKIKKGMQIRHIKQFCVNGHNTAICGRDKSGHCKSCQKEFRVKNVENNKKWQKDFYLQNRIKINLKNKKWADSHRKHIREYKKLRRVEHPEFHRLDTLKQKSERNLRIPKWADIPRINKIVNLCPIGMVVDHIIPLLGKKVSGLHVSWNLQYLTESDNRFKSNKFDGTVENNSWRKDFKRKQKRGKHK